MLVRIFRRGEGLLSTSYQAAMYAEDRKKMAYVYWQHEDMWIGYLQEFPDYWTQGVSREELEENLGELWKDLGSDAIPEVRRMAELHIS